MISDRLLEMAIGNHRNKYVGKLISLIILRSGKIVNTFLQEPKVQTTVRECDLEIATVKTKNVNTRVSSSVTHVLKHGVLIFINMVLFNKK